MRLFLAFEVPEVERRRVIDNTQVLRRRLPRARWVRPEALHLTLVFLGETAAALLPRLDGELAPVFGQAPRMRLQLAGGGCFPPRGPGRVAWIGFTAGPALGVLQERLEAAVAALLDRPAERRPFHPHLTLARCDPPWPRPAVDAWTNGLPAPQGEPFEVSEGVLLESHLEPGGARYEELAAYPLAAER